MALTLLSANNASTVLAAGISASATTLTVNTGTGGLFPSPVSGTSFFKLTLIDAATGTLTEIVHVTARTGDTMTIVRGQEGTVSRLWSANDIAANMMTAGTLDLFAQSGTLGGAALLNVGTTAGTVAAGNDNRITGALQKSANLSDLSNVQTALANLTLTDMGIGLPSMTAIANFDFNNFVLTSGANYLTDYNTWLNPPAGVTFNAGTAVSVTVENISGSMVGLTLTPLTVSNANYHVFKVIGVGAAGARVFTVREVLTSANPVPISGGGTGGKTAAEALTNLGLSDAFTASEIAATPWVNLTLSNGWTTYPDLKCAYRKVLGLVFVEVNARNGTFSDGTILATLPVGYRPAKAVIAPVLGQSLANTVPARVSVNVDGAIVLVGFSSAATAGLLFNFSLQ